MKETASKTEKIDEGRPGETRRALYGRRMGRPLRPHRRALVEGLLPTVEIAVPRSGERIEPGSLFRQPCEAYWLEIGFGAGEHLAWQARRHPGVGFIGCEPYLNGVAHLLTDMEKDGLVNIRIFRDDARLLLEALPDAAIARAFVLFPDPWPKSRHSKRRIIGPAALPDLARVLRDGAEMRIATDDPRYKAWILDHVLTTGAFDWLARRPSDWRCRPDDWPATRYEKKAVAAGRHLAFFRFSRRFRAG